MSSKLWAVWMLVVVGMVAGWTLALTGSLTPILATNSDGPIDDSDAPAAAEEPLPDVSGLTRAQQAVHPDARIAEAAIAELRAAGPEGYAELRAAHAGAIESAHVGWEYSDRLPSTEEWGRLSHALDKVAGVNQAHAIDLFWHTDLQAARTEAAQTGKTVLSLRMLGRLDEAYSCANSRYFRTILYTDPTIAGRLRDSFVLHWATFRDIPTITVEMGDGRRIHRTITGNSMHIAMAPDGTVIDALPGLVDPASFTSWVDGARQVGEILARVNGSEARTAFLRRHWSRDRDTSAANLRALIEDRVEERDATARAAMLRAFSKSGAEMPIVREVQPRTAIVNRAAPEQLRVTEISPSAVDALPLTSTKSGGEARLTRAMQPMINRPTIAPADRGDSQPAETATNNAAPATMSLYADGYLSAEAIRMMRTLSATDEAGFDRMLATFRRTLAEDTRLNLDELQPRIYRMLLAMPDMSDDALTDWVYAELFLTPDTDPWLGLAPADAFTALPEDGLIDGE